MNRAGVLLAACLLTSRAAGAACPTDEEVRAAIDDAVAGGEVKGVLTVKQQKVLMPSHYYEGEKFSQMTFKATCELIVAYELLGSPTAGTGSLPVNFTIVGGRLGFSGEVLKLCVGRPDRCRGCLMVDAVNAEIYGVRPTDFGVAVANLEKAIDDGVFRPELLGDALNCGAQAELTLVGVDVKCKSASGSSVEVSAKGGEFGMKVTCAGKVVPTLNVVSAGAEVTTTNSCGQTMRLGGKLSLSHLAPVEFDPSLEVDVSHQLCAPIPSGDRVPAIYKQLNAEFSRQQQDLARHVQGLWDQLKLPVIDSSAVKGPQGAGFYRP